MYSLLTKDRKLIQELFVYRKLFFATFAQMTITFSKESTWRQEKGKYWCYYLLSDFKEERYNNYRSS